MTTLKRRALAAALALAALAEGVPWFLDGPARAVSPQAQNSARPQAARPAPRPNENDDDDDDEALVQAAMVRRSLQENCLICHGEDMISGQRLTSAQWKAEVEKMVGWGAPLPVEARADLIEYLSRAFSDQTPAPAPERAAIADLGSLEVPAAPGERPALEEADADRGARLYATNCASCHAANALGSDLGPSLTAKAVLSHQKAFERIVHDGRHRMPGFKLILNARDEADILAWLHGLSYPPKAPAPAAR